jgi:hypothetical protein
LLLVRATMSQEPSLRQSGRFVRRALTAYTIQVLNKAPSPLDDRGLSIRNSASSTITRIVRIETEAIKLRAGQTSDAKNGE